MRPEMNIQLYKNQTATEPMICLAESQVTTFFPLHWHDYYELEFVREGRGLHWLNNQPMELSPGSAYLLTPTDMHRLEADAGETIKLYSLKLSGSVPQGMLFRFLSSQESAAFAGGDASAFAEMARLFEALRRELQSASPYRGERVSAYALLLITELMRRANLCPAPPSGAATLRQVRLALTYIREHSAADLKLAQTAQAVSLSPCYLSSLFASVVGCGFVEYVTDCRLQTARSLLRASDVSITEAAFEAGFGSMSQFFRTFKAAYGMSPSRWREDGASGAQ